MDATLGGKLAFFIGVAIALALPLAWALLALYGRALARGMIAQTSGGAPTPLPAAPPRDKPWAAATYLAAEHRLHSRLFRILAISAMIPALALAVTDLVLSGEELRVTAFLAYAASVGSLLIPMMKVYLGWSLRRGLAYFFIYLLACSVALVAWPMVRDLVLHGKFDLTLINNARWFLQFLLLSTWLPLLLMSITGLPRLRTVIPVSLSLALGITVGPALALEWVQLVLAGGPGEGLLVHLGLSGTLLLGLAAGGLLAFGLLRLIAARYQQKRFSDLQLLTDIWWLLVVLAGFAQLVAVYGHAWLPPLAGAVFILYRTTVGWGFAHFPPPDDLPPNRRLLLLRVFGDSPRSERLFDSLIQRWRYIGSVKLIAAPDLAARMIDPEDLLRFVQRRLGEGFIGDAGELATRLRTVDEARDPDGRFRVSEFYCRDKAWQDTLHALLERSDVILMDLRGFCQSRVGCAYELEALARRNLLPRTVLLVDASTDQPLVTRILAGALVKHVESEALAKNADALFRALLPPIQAPPPP
ncbi:MAG: hypothetical protein JNJ44_02780 [Zoogloeaceae bacterium]|nr:hypothetical protein [Zoogloeaceae bacterium]